GEKRGMRKIVLPMGVAAALALVPAASALAAKPGPAALAGHPGTVVISNSQILKGGAPSELAGDVFGKTASFPVSPDVSNYHVVSSGNLANPNGAQTRGEADCPAGTVAFSGGVFGSSTSLNQNVNGSIPLVSGAVATGWVGWMDNASGSD